MQIIPKLDIKDLEKLRERSLPYLHPLSRYELVFDSEEEAKWALSTLKYLFDNMEKIRQYIESVDA